MASTKIIEENGEDEENPSKKQDLDRFDDESSVSSSDSDSEDEDSSSENRPPEKISIERSVDLASVKSNFIDRGKIAEIKPSNFLKEELEKMRLENKNNLTQLTRNFENLGVENSNFNQENRPLLDIRRENSIKNRVKRVFFESKNPENSSPKNCCPVCQILLKSSDAKETIIRLKKAGIFHRKCFKCADCYKILTPKEYWIIGQSYYCKFHVLKKERPDEEITVEMAENLQTRHEQPDDEEIVDFVLLADDVQEEDDEEDFAFVTQPKHQNPDVIKSGTKSESDFPLGIGLTALQEKKKTFSTVTEPEDRRKSIDIDQMIKQGQVKDTLSRFNGIGPENEESIEEDEDFKNANICRSTQKKREELRLDVDAKILKSKFENAASCPPAANAKVPSAQPDVELRAAELNALKSASSVSQTKDKFLGGQPDDSDFLAKKCKVSDEITPLAAASIQEAKEKFMKGDFGDSTSQVSSEKYREPIPFTELTSVRERFEQNAASTADGSDLRRSVSPSPSKPAVGRSAELSTLKASFESGGKKKFTAEELETKRRKILESEFKRLEIEKSIFNEKQRREAEEEAKNLKIAPNQDSTDQEVQKCPELNLLKQRFEFSDSSTIVESKPAILDDFTPNQEAKSLKAKFESGRFENAIAAIDNEEKLKNIRAEFQHFREIKENDSEKNLELDLEEKTTNSTSTPQEDLAAAAEYAQKMRAKWEKIQRKEAKKAQKAANAKQKVSSPLPTCQSCQKRAYTAESIECDCKLYHVTCFKCKQCGCCLRLENCSTGPDGLYCKNHFKLLFGNFSKTVKENGGVKCAEVENSLYNNVDEKVDTQITLQPHFDDGLIGENFECKADF